MDSRIGAAGRRTSAPGTGSTASHEERTRFLLLFSGQTVSMLGTGITVVAMPAVAVLALHASTLAVALISAAGYVPYSVLGLIAGVYVDRWSRRAVLICSDVARTVIFGSVPLLWGLGLLSVWYLIGAAMLAGVFQLFFDTAYQAFLPEIVSRGRLARANAQLQGSASVTTLAGPSAAGLLISWLGAPLAIVADAATYLVSFISLLAIRKPQGTQGQPRPQRADAGQRGPERSDSGIRTEVAEGLRYVMRDRLLRALLGTIAQYNISDAMMQALVVLFLLRVVRVPAVAVGFLLAARGVGAILGALVAGRLTRRLGIGPAMTLAATAGPVFGILLPFTYDDFRLSFFVVASVALGAAETMLKVAGVTYRQASVPAHMLGRVVATNRAFTWGPVPLGGVLAGVLGELAGVRWALLAVALLAATAPVWLVTARAWRVREVAAQAAGSSGE